MPYKNIDDRRNWGREYYAKNKEKILQKINREKMREIRKGGLQEL
jgi:hypothetical protein